MGIDFEDLKRDITEANIENLMVAHLAGSHAYNMATPESDIDVRGIFCASRKSVTTPYYVIREQTMPSMEDAKVYELKNFMKLYTDGNPNILESLWVKAGPEGDVLATSTAYGVLRAYREELLSTKVAFTFSGYALSQLKRIKGHNKWINNPQPVEAPMHKHFIKMIQNFTCNKVFARDFNVEAFSEFSLIPYGNNIFGIVDYLPQGPSVLTRLGEFNLKIPRVEDHELARLAPKAIIKYCAEEFKRAKENHYNYWSWKNNRNQKRSILEEEYGYDTKHASHLVRLLRMGEEILTGQGVIVKRPDAQDLLDIRAGLWDYDDLVKWAEEKDKLIRGPLYENSGLPKKPDIELASNILMDIQDIYWNA